MKRMDFQLPDGGISIMQVRIFSILFVAVLILAAASSAGAQTPPPALFFSDLDSGPNSGGESVSGYAGAYVTLYGNFFGTAQGTSTVTWNGLNCLRVLPSTGSYTGWGMTYFWYQKIVVQLSSSCTAGAGNFVVTTSAGTSNGIPFTVRSGNIYFVAATGNDSTGTGTISSPWATTRHCVTTMAAGGTCYINGVTETDSTGYTAVLVLNGLGGTSAGNSALVAYPGSTPVLGTANGSGQQYAVRCAAIGGSCSYWTIAGFQLYGGGGGGEAINPFGQSTNPCYDCDGHWRIVANYISCPQANGDTGCIETNEIAYLKEFGNEVTNVGISQASKQQHALYLCSDTNHAEVGWNYIHNNLSCRAIQIYSSPLGGGGTGDPTGHNQFDISLHDNLIHDDPCDGINIASVDPSQGKVEAYNNLIYHVGLGPDPADGEASYSCIRMAEDNNNGSTPSGNAEVYNNTLVDCGSHVGTYGWSGTLAIAGGSVGLDARNNIAYQLSGEFFTNSGGTASGLTLAGSNNIWFGGNQAAPSWTTSNIIADPLFVNTSINNFHLQSGSPAVDAGITISSSNSFNGYQVWNGMPMDRDGVTRPQGSAYDVGAYEYFAGGSTVQKPNPPTNLKVVVQ
jgi:hypothetical protein